MTGSAVCTQALLDEYTCSTCLHIMVHPVTLRCGHSLCRLCLVKHFEAFTASVRDLELRDPVCPVGRCSVRCDVPAVNVTLQNAIGLSHHALINERRAEVDAEASVEEMNQRALALNKFASDEAYFLGEEAQQPFLPEEMRLGEFICHVLIAVAEFFLIAFTMLKSLSTGYWFRSQLQMLQWLYTLSGPTRFTLEAGLVAFISAFSWGASLFTAALLEVVVIAVFEFCRVLLGLPANREVEASFLSLCSARLARCTSMAHNHA